MESTSNEMNQRACERELQYQRERTKNRVFSKLVKFFAEEAESNGISKKVLADRLDKDPAQLSRWLSQPSNLTLETISDLLLVMDAELECRVVKLAEQPIPNLAHEWANDYLHIPIPKIAHEQSTETSVAGYAKFQRYTGAASAPSLSYSNSKIQVIFR